MPKPLDPAKRQAIAETIRTSGANRSRNDIAREHGVAASTVGKIADDEGITFDRTHTVNATRARQVDLAAGRAELQARWLVKANEGLDRSERPCVVFSFGGQFNEYAEHTLEVPPAADYRSFVTAAAVATDKMIALAKLDAADDGVGAAVSAVDRIMGALRGEHVDAGD